jgi:hypothetical protein
MGALMDEVLLLLPIVKFWVVEYGTIDNHVIKGEKESISNNSLFPSHNYFLKNTYNREICCFYNHFIL